MPILLNAVETATFGASRLWTISAVVDDCWIATIINSRRRCIPSQLSRVTPVAARDACGMRVVWKRDLDGYYGSAFFGGGTRLHVVAEMLPDAGWDWVAWSNDDPGRTLNGRSCTREVAIRQAEQAGRVLAEGEGAKSKAA